MKSTSRKRFLITLSLLVMFVMGLALRLMFLPANTVDMKVFNLKWYDYIVEHGRFNALGDEFANYTPPYLYLLSLATLTKPFLPKLTAIKLIPIIFDLINLILVYQIVGACAWGPTLSRPGFAQSREALDSRKADKTRPMFAAMTFWLLPTVMVNSAFWGQVDSLYVCFLLLCVLFLLKEHWTAAAIAFSISFAIKAQAFFLLPLLAIHVLKEQIPWRTFLLIPPVYFIMMLPSVLAGRSLTSLALVYLRQAQTFDAPSKNAANLYFFIPPSASQIAITAGFLLAGVVFLTWILVYGFKRYEMTPSTLIIAVLVSVALTPFLLPKMHDRYFHSADIFSLIAAFFIPEIWFVPVAYQVVSLFSYLPYLFGMDAQKAIPPAILINTLTIAFLLWKQWKIASQTA